MTTDRTPPARLILELVLLWGALPALLYYERRWAGFFVIPGLLAIGLLSARYLSRHGHWHDGHLLARPSGDHLRAALLIRFVPLLLALAGLVRWLEPERFFDLPIERPVTWLVLMLLYPLLSVLPQELLFRGVFFRRYRRIFRGQWSRVFWSGLMFGWAHAIMGNWVAIALSTVGGWMFAYSYLHSRSLTLAWIEHGIWGCAIFTVGLGQYFYGGFSAMQ